MREEIENLICYYKRRQASLRDLKLAAIDAASPIARYYFGGRLQMCEETIQLLQQVLKSEVKEHGNP